MKAAQINNYGSTADIRIQDATQPEVKADTVLVKVEAAGLNPFDAMVLTGMVVPAANTSFPLTLGQDFAGEVVQVGDSVSHVKPGDKVYGSSNALFGGSGAFAEYVLAASNSLALSPAEATSEQAAGLPTAGNSALQALDTLNIQAGQTVFIDGAAGGVGSYAVQIAKSRGAKVIALASTENSDFVKSLGADEVIDYKTTDFKTIVKDVDAVVHTVRAISGNDVLATLKKGGTAVALTGDLDETKAAELGVTAVNQMTHTNTEALNKLGELVANGKVTTHIAATFNLDDTAKAYDTLTNDSIAAKIVIKP